MAAGKIALVVLASVVAACGSDERHLGGTVSRMIGEIVLVENGSAQTILIDGNGDFVFPRSVANGDAYDVRIAVQPVEQTCQLLHGNGTAADDVTDIEVRCPGFLVGGTVHGLAGTLELTDGTETLSIEAEGAYEFAALYLDGEHYEIDVVTQPTAQSCDMAAASGEIAGADVTVAIDCVATHTVGGTVSGLDGGTLRITLDDQIAGGHHERPLRVRRPCS